MALGLVLGAVFGVAARLGAFCLLRGMKGLRPGGDLSALRAFALAMLVALLATQGLNATGATDLGAAMQLNATNPWVSMLTGGVIFGLGMVLANACGARSLVLLAGGNLRSLLVLLCLGLAAQATLTGVLAPLRMAVQRMGTRGDETALPQLLQAAGLTGPLALGLSIALPALALGWFAWPVLRRSRIEALAAAVIGLAIAGGWWITFATDDPFDPRPLISLSFVGPVGEGMLWMMLATGRQAGFAVAVIGGTILGAFATALATRSFRAEGFGSARQMLGAVAGGSLMGFGGVLALGCSIGQGLSGFSTLSIGSLVALAGIVAGIAAGLSLTPQPTPAGART
nr:YeeE/YedE family protein [Paracoccus sp. S-4012]